MEDTPEARRQLAGRLYEVGGRPISPDDPIFDVVFIAREVVRDENAKLIKEFEALASSIAKMMALESVKAQSESKSLIERLEAIENRRAANGQATARQLVELMAEQTRQIVRDESGKT